ncbi:hypothetical protein, partial [Sutterella wadsworthensis]|uniref:hypothetical protein n=1 Tax=Sutterella wadsworthensis TaxID=40545 RepID=UPI003076D0FB
NQMLKEMLKNYASDFEGKANLLPRTFLTYAQNLWTKTPLPLWKSLSIEDLCGSKSRAPPPTAAGHNDSAKSPETHLHCRARCGHLFFRRR